MNQTVEECDLDFQNFRCCGDEDLYPFQCPRCGRLMVFCYECDTLYGNLYNLDEAGRYNVNHFDPSAPIFVCPECKFPFEYFFVRDGMYKSTFGDWKRKQLCRLLRSSLSLVDDELHRSTIVEPGGVPIDLNSGMIQTLSNQPQGFVSKLSFSETDIVSRINAINWFAQCGKALSLNLSMEIERIHDWETALDSCKTLEWENVELNAQNQLTVWLCLYDSVNYQKWNDIVDQHKISVLNDLSKQTIVPFQLKHSLNIEFSQSVQWDILGALMANSYLSSGHKVFFFLELLMVYEAGHFPCGWLGEWPKGKLRVF